MEEQVKVYEVVHCPSCGYKQMLSITYESIEKALGYECPHCYHVFPLGKAKPVEYPFDDLMDDAKFVFLSD